MAHTNIAQRIMGFGGHCFGVVHANQLLNTTRLSIRPIQVPALPVERTNQLYVIYQSLQSKRRYVQLNICLG